MNRGAGYPIHQGLLAASASAADRAATSRSLHQHPLPGRHINVIVEPLEYRRWPLTALRRRDGRLVRGETVPAGTVAEQLAHLG